MANGYGGKILRINLSSGETSVEKPEDVFYRRYIGGRGFISYFLLKELERGIDALDPRNKLIFANGPVTGVPVAGSGRNSVGAKSPLTGGYGDAEVGGFWGAELKHAGYDAMIIDGKARSAVYIWIQDDKVEIRDAKHLWGKTTLECQKAIQDELGSSVRVCQIGVAGENQVRYACIVNDINHAAGRCGIGAVMGSKNLRAIAVKGQQKVALADAEAVTALAKWLVEDCKTNRSAVAMSRDGTSTGVEGLNAVGGLPTRNFQQGVFEGADKISGAKMKETILVRRGGCFACPIHCKPHVSVPAPYNVDPEYGGPEYETMAALGSNCGVDDLGAVAKGNQLCSAYGLDTISTGDSIAFAMECFENGIINESDTGGLKLNFGNAQAMLQMVEMIALKQGIGEVLAEGVARAAATFGKGAERFAMHVKGQEIPMHEPRYKPGLGVGYTISPTGADHCHNIHDNIYSVRVGGFLRGLGVSEPLPTQELSPAKVRMVMYGSLWNHALNCLVYCSFVPLSLERTVNLVKGITGWDTNSWELMKAAERCVNMSRVFNVLEGQTAATDSLPRRFFVPFDSGPLKGVVIKEAELAQAVDTYYGMMGWDKNGVPSRAKLQELGIGWAAEIK
jgi:aldehyde:ferredoxin oxidoreductase